MGASAQRPTGASEEIPSRDLLLYREERRPCREQIGERWSEERCREEWTKTIDSTSLRVPQLDGVRHMRGGIRGKGGTAALARERGRKERSSPLLH